MSSSTVYEGKAKSVEFLNEKEVKITFHDRITAGNGAKKDNIPGKGALNLKLTNQLFEALEIAGIPNHKIKKISENEIIALKLQIFKIEVVVRNVAAGSYARRYGLKEGTKLDSPIIEYFVKDDDLNDPLIDGKVAVSQKLISDEELSLITSRALQANKLLFRYFKSAGMLLVDFKLEFGKDIEGNIFLADELSADSMRVWNQESGEKLDKDRFRKDLGDVLSGYKEIIDRLENCDFVLHEIPIVANVSISPKEGVTNPAGEVTKRALSNSGLKELGDVVIGKSIEIEISKPLGNEWINDLHNVAKSLLSNPLIEKYEITFDIKD